MALNDDGYQLFCESLNDAVVLLTRSNHKRKIQSFSHVSIWLGVILVNSAVFLKLIFALSDLLLNLSEHLKS